MGEADRRGRCRAIRVICPTSNAVKRFSTLRRLIPLALGVAVAAVASFWPEAPRLTLPHDRICWDLAFSRDGSMLAMLDRDAGLDTSGQVLVWDAATGKLLNRLDYGARVYPSKIVFAPDGMTIGIVDAGQITKWDMTTGRATDHTHAHWSHDPDQYYGREILFAADGRWLAHNLHEGCVYDVATGAVVHEYHERWPDRSYVAQGGCVAAFVNGQVTTFDAVTGAEIATFPTAAPGGPMARSTFATSADGTQGIYLGNRNQWVVHDAATGHECAWGRETDQPLNNELRVSTDHRFLAVSALEPITGVVSAVQARLAGGQGWLRVYDTTTGAEVCRPFAHGSMGRFAPDGKTLAVAEFQAQRVSIWDWPPRSRWPLVLALALPTTVLGCVFAWWRGRRRA
jgi:WD40 repeat protein